MLRRTDQVKEWQTCQPASLKRQGAPGLNPARRVSRGASDRLRHPDIAGWLKRLDCLKKNNHKQHDNEVTINKLEQIKTLNYNYKIKLTSVQSCDLSAWAKLKAKIMKI